MNYAGIKLCLLISPPRLVDNAVTLIYNKVIDIGEETVTLRVVPYRHNVASTL